MYTGPDEFPPRQLSISERQPQSRTFNATHTTGGDAQLVPPAPRHRSTTTPWRFMMYPTVHSFRTSGGVIATAEA